MAATVLHEHRSRLSERMRQLQAGGNALDDKISHDERHLGDA